MNVCAVMVWNLITYALGWSATVKVSLALPNYLMLVSSHQLLSDLGNLEKQRGACLSWQNLDREKLHMWLMALQ